MCGIVGLAGDFPPDLASAAVSVGVRSILHRGPDEQIQVFLEPGCHLGMTRLAIRDLHRGLYPTTDCAETAFAVFNGEIYNADALSNFLASSRHSLKSATDGEVIPHLYEASGLAGLSQIKGMFALALWDSVHRILVLQRDQVGIKPLYYAHVGTGLAFASEITALERVRSALDPTLTTSLRQEAVEGLTHAMFLPAWQETAFDGVHQVPPGHQLVWSGGGTSLKPTSSAESTEPVAEIKNFEEAVIETRRILKESVARHLVSDVPVSIALSGGIDSSLLAALAVKQGANLDAFTVTFKGDSRSEGSQASAFAASLGIPMHDVELDPRLIAENFEEHVHLYMDLSTLDGGTISTSLMAATMRERGFRVGLFGEGADETFSGYTWFGLASGAYRFLPGRLRQRAWWFANTREFRTHREEIPTATPMSQPLDSLMAQEFGVQLPNHLLVKIDRGTMAHGLEGRVPYLDDYLLDWVRNIPVQFRAPELRFGLLPDASRTKPLLRAAAEPYLGTLLTSTPKKGFMLPLDTIVNFSQERISDLVNSDTSVTRALLPPAALKRLRSTQRWTSMPVHMTWMMWRVLVLESVSSRWRSVH